MMTFDLSKLTNVVKSLNGEIQARCPACAAAGADSKGNHLKIFADGKFACAANQGDGEHRKEILRLAGVKTASAARFGRITVDAFKAEDSKVLMDLTAVPRFARKPRGDSKNAP